MCDFKRIAAAAAAMTMAFGTFVTANADEAQEPAKVPTVELVSRDDTVRGGDYKKYDIMYTQEGAATGIKFRLDMPKGMEMVDMTLNESDIRDELDFEMVSVSKKMVISAFDGDGQLCDEAKTVKIGTVVVKTNGVDGDLSIKGTENRRAYSEDLKEMEEKLNELDTDEFTDLYAEDEDLIYDCIDDYMEFADLKLTFTPDVASAKAGDTVTYKVDLTTDKDIAIFQTSVLFSDVLEYDHYVGEDEFDIPNDFNYDLVFPGDIDNEVFDNPDYTFVGMNKSYFSLEVEDGHKYTNAEVNSLTAGTYYLCDLAFKAVTDIDDTNGLFDNYYTIAINNDVEGDFDTDSSPMTFTQKLNSALTDMNAVNDSKSEVKGDVNGSSEVDVSDLTGVAAHVKGIRNVDEYYFDNADVDGDGELTVTDLTKIAAHVKGIRAL